MWRLADTDEERGMDASNHDILFSQRVSVNGRIVNLDVHLAAVLGVSYAEVQRKWYLCRTQVQATIALLGDRQGWSSCSSTVADK